MSRFATLSALAVLIFAAVSNTFVTRQTAGCTHLNVTQAHPHHQHSPQPAGVEQWYSRPVAIRNLAHNTLLRAHPEGDGARVDVQEKGQGPWEVFYIEPAQQPGKVTLKTSHGLWLRARPDGRVDQSLHVSSWEQWEVVPIGPERFNFRSAHGKFLRAQPGGEGAGVDQTDPPHAWERWTIVPANVV